MSNHWLEAELDIEAEKRQLRIEKEGVGMGRTVLVIETTTTLIELSGGEIEEILKEHFDRVPESTHLEETGEKTVIENALANREGPWGWKGRRSKTQEYEIRFEVRYPDRMKPEDMTDAELQEEIMQFLCAQASEMKVSEVAQSMYEKAMQVSTNQLMGVRMTSLGWLKALRAGT